MACKDQILSENYADIIVGFTSTAEEFIQRYENFCPIPIGSGYGTIFRPVEEVLQGIRNGEFTYEQTPKLYGLMDTVAVESTGAIRLQKLPGLELRGNGTIIGIVDDGIDAYHEAFRFSNGDSRILSVWDQTNQTLDPPRNQQYGSVLSNQLINEELKNENSEILRNLSVGSAHGTFVARIAAGNNNEGKGFASPAPSADLAIVKLKPAKQYLRDYYLINESAKAYQENDILNAVIYLREIAAEYERPIVICLPLGSSQGGHGGASVMGDVLNATAGRIGTGVVIANGNEGNSRHHFNGLLSSEVTYEDVEVRVAPDIRGFMLEVWGRSPDIYTVEITSPTGEKIGRIPARTGRPQEFNFVFERTKLTVIYDVVENRTGNEVIQLRFESPTTGIWKIRVYGENIIFGRFNIWLPITEFVGSDTYFLRPDPFITLTNPADTFTPISVGAYSTETEGLFLESGRGYPIDESVKPSFVAPGVNVYGPGLNNSYVRRTGTSVAAGLTAGILAQMFEWGIVRGNSVDMNTTEIKNYLIRGAVRRPSLSYPNREWGYGTINVYNSIDILRF